MIIIIIIKDENKLTSGVISSKFRYLNPESLFLFFKCWKIFSNLVRTILSLFFFIFFSVFKVIYKFTRWMAKIWLRKGQEAHRYAVILHIDHVQVGRVRFEADRVCI